MLLLKVLKAVKNMRARPALLLGRPALLLGAVLAIVVLAFLTPREPFDETTSPQPTFEGRPLPGHIAPTETPKPKNKKRSRRCDSTNEWRRPENLREFAMLRILRARVREFADHMRASYPTDQRALDLLQNWNGNVNYTTQDNGGTFYHNGCLVINPYVETKKASETKAAKLERIKTPGTKPGMDDLGRLLTRMLYLLSFTTKEPLNHFDTFRWFLNVAAEELGWPVVVTCNVCCRTSAPCTRDLCPKCTWLSDPQTCQVTEDLCTNDKNKDDS